MPLAAGLDNICKIYQGATEITSIYQGTQLVYSSAVPSITPHYKNSALCSSTSTTTTHPIIIPSVEVGDMLVTVFSIDGNPTMTSDNICWNCAAEYLNTDDGSPASSVWWKIADGINDSHTLTSSASERDSHVTYGICCACYLSVSPTACCFDSNTSYRDAPSITMDCCQDVMFLTSFAADAQVNGVIQPSGYTNLKQAGDTSNFAAMTNVVEKCIICSGYTATENPSCWFDNFQQESVLLTLAIGCEDYPITPPVYPQVINKVLSTTSSSTTHDIDVGTPTSGNMIVALFGYDNNLTETQSNACWDTVDCNCWIHILSGTPQTATVTGIVYAKIADGTANDCLTVCTSSAAESNSIVYEVCDGAYICSSSMHNSDCFGCLGCSGIPITDNYLLLAGITGLDSIKTPPSGFGNLCDSVGTNLYTSISDRQQNIIECCVYEPSPYTINTHTDNLTFNIAIASTGCTFIYPEIVSYNHGENSGSNCDGGVFVTFPTPTGLTAGNLLVLSTSAYDNPTYICSAEATWEMIWEGVEGSSSSNGTFWKIADGDSTDRLCLYYSGGSMVDYWVLTELCNATEVCACGRANSTSGLNCIAVLECAKPYMMLQNFGVTIPCSNCINCQARGYCDVSIFNQDGDFREPAMLMAHKCIYQGDTVCPPHHSSTGYYNYTVNMIISNDCN